MKSDRKSDQKTQSKYLGDKLQNPTKTTYNVPGMIGTNKTNWTWTFSSIKSTSIHFAIHKSNHMIKSPFNRINQRKDFLPLLCLSSSKLRNGPRCGLYLSFCFKLSFKSNFFLAGCCGGCCCPGAAVEAPTAVNLKTFSALPMLAPKLQLGGAIPAGIQGDFCVVGVFPFCGVIFC